MASWIFQSSPKYFKLPEALEEAEARGNNMIEFLVTKYEDEIKRDDTVYVCFGGQKNPGLYAVTTVQTDPSDTLVPAPWQESYAEPGPHPWDEKAGKKPIRVRLKIERRLAVPVARHEIYALENMAHHQFVKTHGAGTNFKLTPGQASAIERLISGQATAL